MAVAIVALVLLAVEPGAQPSAPGSLDDRAAEEDRLLESWRSNGTLGMSLGRALLLAGGAAFEELDALEAELDATLELIERRVRPRHSAQRKARTVFTELHRHVLQRYDLYAQPVDLLRGGRYNCVTASALFYLAAERVGVPVELRVTPVHVFAVADPGGAALRVEMTEPRRGFGYGEGREATLRLILNQKLVTEEELWDLGEEEVYRMFSEESYRLAPAQLVGVVYHNLGVTAWESGDYDAGEAALSRAMHFEAEAIDSRSAYVMMVLSAVFEATEPDSAVPLLLRSLAQMSGDLEFGGTIVPGLLVIGAQLAKQGRFEDAVDLIAEAERHIGGDEDVAHRLTRMSATLHHDWARSLARRGMSEAALEKSGRALDLWPENRAIIELHVQTQTDLATQRARQSRWEEAIDILEGLEVSLEEFPVVANVAGSVAHFILLDSRGRTEWEALRQIEALLIRLYSLAPDEPLVRRGRAWILHELAMGHVREGAYRPAEALVLEALEYAPDVDYLHQSLDLIRDRR